MNRPPPRPDEEPDDDDLDDLLDSGLRQLFASGSGAPPAADEPKRDWAGRFRLVEELARGGIGIVYRGHDERLGRDVAVKVLRAPHAQHVGMVGRFLQEAQVAGQLQHPGNVPIYESGLDEEGRPFLVMKLVEGRTLAALLKERADPTADRRRYLGIFEQACQIVAYAHHRRFVHRDLKPTNIMVGEFGEVQVVDWGLAKVLEGALPDQNAGTGDSVSANASEDIDPAAPDRGGSSEDSPGASLELETNLSADASTRPDSVAAEPDARQGSARSSRGSSSRPGSSASIAGSVLGTPAYMAPEQARGEVDQVDERADVFSLGALLCEILTDHAPYLGEERETLGLAQAAALEDAHARLDQVQGAPELVDLTRRCLQANRDDRPGNAAEVAAAVQDYLGRVEDRAQAAEIETAVAQDRAEQERRARRVVIVLAAAIVVLGFTIGAAMWREDLRERGERAETDAQIEIALSDVRRLASEGSLGAAAEALTRAKVLLETGKASDEKRGDLRTATEELEREQDAAETRARRLGQERRFGAALAEIQSSGSESVPDEYAAVFVEHELPIEDLEPEQVAERLAYASHEFRLQLCTALEDWAWHLRQSQGRGPPSPRGEPRGRPPPDRAGPGGDPRDPRGRGPGRGPDREWQRLIHVAQLLDPDPARHELREAIRTEDTDTLVSACETLDPSTVQPATLSLLATSLWRLGSEHLARELLRAAYEVYPSDASINSRLASYLADGLRPMRFGMALADPRAPGVPQALHHAWIAVSLNPDSPIDWLQLGALSLAVDDVDGAAFAARQARQLAPNRAPPMWLDVRATLAGGQWDQAFAKTDALRGPAGGPASWAEFLVWSHRHESLDRRLRDLDEWLIHWPEAGFEMDRVVQLAQAARFDAALESLDSIDAAAGVASELDLVRAHCLINRGRYDEAVVLLESREFRDSRTAARWLEQARGMARAQSAVAEGRGPDEDPVVRARLFLHRDQWQDAARWFERAGDDGFEVLRPGSGPSGRGDPRGPGRGEGRPEGSGPGRGGPGGPGGGRPPEGRPGEPRSARARSHPRLDSPLRDAAVAFSQCSQVVTASEARRQRELALRCVQLAGERLTFGSRDGGPPDRGRMVHRAWLDDERLAPLRDDLESLPGDERVAFESAWHQLRIAVERSEGR